MIKFEKIRKDDAHLPIRSTIGSAGYDFFANELVVIQPKTIGLVKTGIRAQFPNTKVLKLYNRSSNPIKRGIMLANGVGIVDSDYYGNESNGGEIMFAFYNFTDSAVIIEKDDKIGQGIFEDISFTDDDMAYGLRNGGFGSTDIE
jgi:dUTP pyrophosphatase